VVRFHVVADLPLRGLKLVTEGRIVQRRYKFVAVVSGVLLVAGGVSFGYLSRLPPDSGCYGLVDTSKAADLIGTEDLESEQLGAVPPLSPGESEYCEIAAAGSRVGRMQMHFDRGARNADLFTSLYRHESHDSRKIVSPIGNGWKGVINVSKVKAHGVVWLPCGDGSKPGITASVVVHPGAGGGVRSSPGGRTRFARTVTEIAESAGAEWGCSMGFGERVESIPAGFSDGVESGLPSEGTCQGVQPSSYGAAAVPEAPVEECIIVDEQAEPQFRLAAYYGPFVQAARNDTSRSARYTGDEAGGSMGFYWVSGKCPNWPALFTVETLDSEDGISNRNPELQKAALDVFANRSAEAHGCTLVR
jgi:hypothetical protein